VKRVEAGELQSDFIAKTPSGILVLEWYQVWKGYALFVAKTHVEELFELASDARQFYLGDMVAASRAIKRAVGAERMNVAQLGNEIGRLHFHLIPRFGETDPGNPRTPIWSVDRALRKPEPRPTSAEILPTIQTIRRSLAHRNRRFRWVEELTDR
jgi:diadenosine tetraphosphate (Ap4A) HIT family hydrolase